MAKYLVSGYTFSPGAPGSGSITISGIFPLEQFLLATNTTDNVVIYQFNSPARGGSVSSTSGNTTLFLNADTSGMNAADKVQLFVDDGADVKVKITNASLEINNDSGNPVPASIASLPLPSGAASETTASGIRVAIASGVNVFAASLPLPSGAATAANQTSGNSSLSSIDTKTPSLQSGAVPIGDNGGSLTVDGRAYSSSVSFNRPGNASGYTAGDVIGVTSGGAAGSAIHTFASIGPSNGHVMLQSVEMFIDASTVPAGMGAFRLHLYNSSPSSIVDNAVFDLQTTDRTKYIGYADLSTPLDLGSVLYSQSDYSGRLLKIASGSTSLFGILQTVNAYTPASGTAHEIRIKTIEAGL